MIWTACFTTRHRRRGSVEHEAQLRSCLNDLQRMRVCLSIGRRRGFQEKAAAKIVVAMRLHLFGRSLFHSCRCFTKLPDKTKNRAAYQKVGAVLALLYFQRAAPASASSPAQSGN